MDLLAMKLGCSPLCTQYCCLFTPTKSLKYQKFPTMVRPNQVELNAKTITRAIRWISDIGLDSMDFQIMNNSHLERFINEDEPRKISEACKEHSVTVDHIACDFICTWISENPSPDVVERTWSRIATVASAVGADVIETVTPSMPPNLATNRPREKSHYTKTILYEDFSWARIWSSFISSMRINAGLAAKHGLKIAVEPRPHDLISNTDALLRLLENVGFDNLGAVVDMSHIHFSHENPVVSIRKLEGQIFSVHMSDNDGVIKTHLPPGEGQIDWLSVLRTLQRVRYSGSLCLEVTGVDVEHELVEGKQYVESLFEMITNG